MSKYIKFYSNYVLREQHQLTKNGKIYERDWVTVGGVNRMSPGQIPVYSNGNFIVTIGNTTSTKKKRHFGNWVENQNNEEEWTLDDVVDSTEGLNELEINEDSDDLRDYAYFGSCVELIRASVENIIKYFPAELYFSSTDFIVANGNENNPFNTYGKIVKNEFGIDLFSQKSFFENGENKMRYFLSEYDEETFVYEHYNIIVGNNVEKISNVTVERYDNEYCNTIFNDGKITINGKYTIKRWIINGEYSYSSEDNIVGVHIRPNDDIINDFFQNLDGFEEKLMNLKSYPKYSNQFLTPVYTSKGYSYVYRRYSWPVVDSWNLDISSISYENFITSLTEVAQFFDDTCSDNIYRAMTHEAIKNFDWTYTRDYYEGESEKYIQGGTKVANLIRIYGRILDNIKRYIDNVKYSNAISYDGKNNVSEYLLTDKLNDFGWVVGDILRPNTESLTTDKLYESSDSVYTYGEVRNQFYKRLLLCSKRIMQSKGTRNSLDMLFSMFGIPSTFYQIREYYKTIENPITDIDKVKNLNLKKEYIIEYENDSYSGLPVKEFNGKLYPYFDGNKNYDGNPYFQMYGGWLKKTPAANNIYDYTETMSYLNVVNSIGDLFLIPIVKLKNGDIYYVNDISDALDYNLSSQNISNYFKLNDIDKYRDISGWENVEYTVIDGEKVITDDKVLHLEEIINDNTGNNPHVGYWIYDCGEEYFKYYTNIFYASTTITDEIGFSLSSISGYGKTLKIQYFDNDDYLKNINSKVIEIFNLKGKEFSDYFNKFILPFLSQLIPSTAIVILNGFDENGGKFLSLSKNRVYLNTSCNNSINEASVSIYSSGDVSCDDPSVEISNNVATIKKKENSEIKFYLNDDEDVYSILSVVYSSIDISENYFEIDSTGGNISINVVSEPNGFYVDSDSDWVSYEINGNSVNFNISENNLINNRDAYIKIVSTNDSNCYCILNIVQFSSELSISCDPSEIVSNYTGGEYYVSVNAGGGSEDYVIKNVENGELLDVIKVSSNKLKIVVSENNSTSDINSSIILSHKDDNNIEDTINVVIQKYSGNLSILINGKSEDTCESKYIGGLINKLFVIEAIGGSRTFIIDEGTIPSWITYSLDVNTLSITLDTNNGDDREYDIEIYHSDDQNIRGIIHVTQYGIGENIIYVEPSTIEASSTGGNYFSTVTVYGGDMDFTYYSNCSEWISISKTMTEYNDNHKIYRLLYNVEKNSSDERECNVVLRHSNDTNLSKNVEIIQGSKSVYSIEARRNGSVINSIDNIPFSGGTYTIDVIVSPENSPYICSSTSSWAIVSQSGYSVTVTISKNETQNDRTCNLEFIHGLDSSKKCYVSLIQKGTGELSILVGNTTSSYTNSIDLEVEQGDDSIQFYIKVEGGSETYKVDSARTSSWIHVNNTTGRTGSVTATLSQNSDDSNRTGQIVFLHSSNNDISAIVNVVQKQGLSISINPSDNNNGKTYTLDVQKTSVTKQINILPSGGSAKYSYSGNSVDWVKLDGQNLKDIIDYGNTSVSITIENNETSSKRTCELKFVHADDSSKFVTLIINQNYDSYSVLIDGQQEVTWDNIEPGISEKEYSVEVEGGSKNYILKSIEYIEGDIDGWLSAIASINTITVKLLENIFSGSRKAKITICHADKNDVEAYIIVEQNEAVIEYRNYKIELMPTGSTFSSDGGTQLVKVKSTRDKYINNEYVSSEDVPFKITIEEDEAATMDNVFKINNNDVNFTVIAEPLGGTISYVVTSKLVNSSTGAETYVVWQSYKGADWITTVDTTNRIDITLDKNETNSKRTDVITLRQDIENYKELTITIVQDHVDQSVEWVEPPHASTKDIEKNEITFYAYANTTALTFNDVVVETENYVDWVTVKSISQGDNLYGERSVKAEITASKNGGQERQINIIIRKKDGI